MKYLGHIYTKNQIHCLSELQIKLVVIYIGPRSMSIGQQQSRLLLLRMRSEDQQHWSYMGVCRKCSILGLTHSY